MNTLTRIVSFFWGPSGCRRLFERLMIGKEVRGNGGEAVISCVVVLCTQKPACSPIEITNVTDMWAERREAEWSKRELRIDDLNCRAELEGIAMKCARSYGGSNLVCCRVERATGAYRERVSRRGLMPKTNTQYVIEIVYLLLSC